MKTPNKIVIANLRQNKKRTMATLIAVILSCTLLFAVGIAYSSFNQYNVNKTAERTGTYHVMYYDIDYQKSRTYLESNKKIKDIYVYQEIDSINLNSNYSYLSHNGKIPVLAYDDAFNKEITIKDGREPQNDTEIILPHETLVYSLKKSIGDKLGKYTIVGTYKNGLINELSIGNLYESIVIGLTKKKIDENNKHSSFLVYYKNKYKTYDNVNEDIQKLGISNSSLVNVQINKKYLDEFGIGKSNPLYALLYCIYAFGLFIISVFCMLIIYNAFAISLNERKKQFGILRSVGTSKRKIIAMITKELMILATIAFPISFGVATGLIALGLKIVNELNSMAIPLSFDFVTLLITVFFVIFSMVLSAYTPGKKASNTSPIEAIRNTRDFKIKNSKRQYNFTKKIFGTEGQLARKNLKRNGKQFGTVVTSLTISLVVFIMMSTVVNLFISAFGFESYEDRGYDTYISIDSESKGNYEKFKDEVKKLESVDEVIEAVRVHSQLDYKTSDMNILESNKEYTSGLAIYVLENDFFEELIKQNNFKENKPILYNVGRYWIRESDGSGYSGNDCIFNPFKSNPIIHLCESKNEQVCNLELKDFNVTTTGLNLDPDGERASLMMSEEQFNKIYQNYPQYFNDPYREDNESVLAEDKYLFIKAPKLREYDKEIKELLKKNSSMVVYLDSIALDYYNTKMLLISIQIALYAIIAFVGVISISGMLNSINTNLSLREREFAMLRSTGVSKKSLNKMIMLENVFLIMKSITATMIITICGYLGLTLLLNWDVEAGIIKNPIVFMIPFPWVYTIIAFIAVILIILFLTSFSIKKIKNQNIIEAIRKDSI